MFGAVWAQAELRKALASAGARVIDRELPVPAAHEAFDEEGTLLERDQMLELDGILAELLGEAARHARSEPVSWS
jgi:chromate reductase